MMSVDQEKQLKELQARLASMGVNLGEWGETVPHKKSPKMLGSQKKALVALRTLLTEQVESDLSEVAQKQAELDKLKHGGGS